MRATFTVTLVTSNVGTSKLFNLFHKYQSDRNVLLLLFSQNYDDNDSDATEDINNIDIHTAARTQKRSTILWLVLMEQQD